MPQITVQCVRCDEEVIVSVGLDVWIMSWFVQSPISVVCDDCQLIEEPK